MKWVDGDGSSSFISLSLFHAWRGLRRFFFAQFLLTKTDVNCFACDCETDCHNKYKLARKRTKQTTTSKRQETRDKRQEIIIIISWTLKKEVIVCVKV